MNSFSSVASAWKPGWLTRAFARFERPDARFTDEEILTVIRAGEGLKVADVCEAADIPVETFYTWKARYGGLSLEGLRDQRRSERRRAKAKTVAVTMLLAGCAVGAAVVVSTLGKPVVIDNAATPLTPPRTTQATAPSVVDGTRPASPSNVAVTPDSTTTASNTTGDSKPASTSALDAKPAGVSGTASTAGPASATSGAASPPAAPDAGPKGTPAPPDTTAKPVAPVATAAATPKPTPPAATRTAPTRADAPDIVTSAPEGISVQVAALPDKDEARMTLTRLSNAGYPAYMMRTVVNQNELYRVRVGPFKSRELAQIMAQRLERDGYAAPWITSTSR